MTDAELNDVLKRARVPEPGSGCGSEVLSQLQLGQGQFVGRGRRDYISFARCRWIGLSTACLIAVVVFVLQFRRPAFPADEMARAQKLISEISALFPNQVRAIVFENGSPRLVLSETPNVPSVAPVLMRICGARGCERVITFSGQRVHLAGMRCEVLVGSRGNVIVTGENFAWASDERAERNGGYHIEAALLAREL